VKLLVLVSPRLQIHRGSLGQRLENIPFLVRFVVDAKRIEIQSALPETLDAGEICIIASS
jgi:hypothetical protein